MNTPKLMLHCGANEVDRKDLGNIVMPPATDTYMPVDHETVLGLAEDRLNEIGFHFGTQAHSLTKNGDRYFGLVELLNGSTSDEHALIVGIRNSIDKSFPAGMAFGSHVFVCDNLAFTGEIKSSRKHTAHILRDLPGLIDQAVQQTTLMKVNQEARFEHWKEANLTKLRADHVIVEMVRRGALNTSRVQKVINEWDSPSHDFGGRTAWRLFNAATEALKGAPLHDMPPRTIRLQSLLDEVTSFVPEMPMDGVERAALWEG